MSLLDLRRLGVKYFEEAGLDFFAWLIEGAFRQDESLRRIRTEVRHLTADRQIGRVQVGILVELRLERFPFRLLGAFQFCGDSRRVAHIFV